MNRLEAMSWAVDIVLNDRRPPQPAPGHAHEWLIVDVVPGMACDSCSALIEDTEARHCEECVVTWCAECFVL